MSAWFAVINQPIHFVEEVEAHCDIPLDYVYVAMKCVK